MSQVMSTDNTSTYIVAWIKHMVLHAMNFILKLTFDGYIKLGSGSTSCKILNGTSYHTKSLVSWVRVLLCCDLFWVIQPSPGLPSKVTCDLMSSHYEPFKIWQMTWRVEWSILIGSGRPIPTSIIPRHEMRQWAKNKRAFQNRELSKVISTTGGLE